MADIAILFPYGRRHRPRAERVFRERRNYLNELRDSEIISRYRLSREAILSLEEVLRDDLSPDTQRSNAVAPLIQILVGLRYLAKGDFLSEVADLHGLSKASAGKFVQNFIEVLNNRLHNIWFPLTEVSVRETKYSFFQKARIPGVIGAIDGTLIPIVAPSRNEEAFVCRKGYHALNVQGVVDTNLRFVDVVAKWPGSMHDSAVFNTSALKEYLEGNNVGHLLGDSGYALKKYLLTPVLNPVLENERRYNNAHARTRVVVERAFGVLKSRFRCLHKTGGYLPFSPEKCCRVVTACVKLHNLCIDFNVPLPEDIEMENHYDNNALNANENVNGQEIRQQIINLM